jgi:serine protease AprX
MNLRHRITCLLIALVFSLGLFSPALVPVTAGVAKLQRALAQIAAASPDMLVAVIVQKADRSDQAELLVAHLGGAVTKNLHIINAFAAELSAGAALELARSDSVRWVSLDAPVASSTTSEFTTWAANLGSSVNNSFFNASAMVDSPLGPDGTFGSGVNAKGSFGGFVAEVTPDNAITKVEVVLQAYVPVPLRDDPTLTVYVGGVAGRSLSFADSPFNGVIGAASAGLVYIDVTATRDAWQWADFDKGIEVEIDQSTLHWPDIIYFDAVGLRVTSASGADSTADNANNVASGNAPLATSALVNVYNTVIGASRLWNEAGSDGNYEQGKNVAVAVVDSGVMKTTDLQGRNRKNVNFNGSFHKATDLYGHGTFVAGLIAGNGQASGGKYIGVAPNANLVNVRVSDDQGMATESDVINGLQWVNDNRAKYNIRVVNLSLNASAAESYSTSPLDAAAEILWFNGIVVVVSAGNSGTATLYPPANDPFVITVGATDDKGTAALTDDVIASFSAYGVAESGLAKPELVTPGTNIIGLLPQNDHLTMGIAHPANRIDTTYFRMSGTSMAAPMVSGAVALLLEDEPNLTPDQVKYRLMATADKSWAGYSATKAGAGYLDIYAAVHGTTTQSANIGLTASQLLWSGSAPITWGSVNWNSVNWNSVNWNSVNWNSVNWNSVNWNSDYWGQ